MTSDPADARPGPAVRLITVSATYGTGGSVVAPALAQRLGLPFLQRATTTEGQVSLAVVPCHEQLVTEEAKATPVHRLLASLTHSMPVGPTQSPLSARHQDEDLRCSAEAGIHDLLANGGGGVILGRAAAVVLGKDRGFHVRLDGPPARRIIQGAKVESISQEQASARQEAADKARAAYVRRLYRVDPADASLYHLVIDSTVIPLDTVIELILTAAQSHHGESIPESTART
ncbi:MAG: cytidylate kinase-like family protein [Streptosporangiaceae bacterium]